MRRSGRHPLGYERFGGNFDCRPVIQKSLSKVELPAGGISDHFAMARSLAAEYQIEEIGFDRWNATQLITQLSGDGATCVPIGQGFAELSAPSKELERLLLEGKLHHGGHPILAWMADYVEVEEDAYGNIRPSKRR